MARSVKLTEGALRGVATTIARHWPDKTAQAATKNSGTSAMQNKAAIRETFEIWTLADNDIDKPWTRLSEVAKPTGKLHHQVHLQGDTAPNYFAHSRLQSKAGGQSAAVKAVMSSPLAAKIDDAISWIDKNESHIHKDIAEEPFVRLLVVPARGVHALWLASGPRDQLVVIDSPQASPGQGNYQLLTLDQFHEFIRGTKRVGALPRRLFQPVPIGAVTKETPIRSALTSRDYERQTIRNVRIFLLLFVAINLVWIILAAAGAGNFQQFLNVLSVCGLLAGSWFIGGTLLGFIFGIPRSLASASAAIAQSTPPTNPSAATSGEYKVARPLNVRPNTNLEEISDWLTKILVGVGLTQITKVLHFVSALGLAVAPALTPLKNAYLIGIAISLAFLCLGFGWGYFESRTTLMRVFSDDSGGPGIGYQPIAEQQPSLSLQPTSTTPATPAALSRT